MMLLLLIMLLLLLAAVGLLIWSSGSYAPNPRRERIVLGAAVLFVMLPPIALAIGALT